MHGAARAMSEALDLKFRNANRGGHEDAGDDSSDSDSSNDSFNSSDDEADSAHTTVVRVVRVKSTRCNSAEAATAAAAAIAAEATSTQRAVPTSASAVPRAGKPGQTRQPPSRWGMGQHVSAAAPNFSASESTTVYSAPRMVSPMQASTLPRCTAPTAAGPVAPMAAAAAAAAAAQATASAVAPAQRRPVNPLLASIQGFDKKKLGKSKVTKKTQQQPKNKTAGPMSMLDAIASFKKGSLRKASAASGSGSPRSRRASQPAASAGLGGLAGALAGFDRSKLRKTPRKRRATVTSTTPSNPMSEMKAALLNRRLRKVGKGDHKFQNRKPGAENNKDAMHAVASPSFMRVKLRKTSRPLR